MACFVFGAVQQAAKPEGGGRTRTAEATLAAWRQHMPAMGITRLANVTGLDRLGLPVVVAVRPNSRALATAQGKGATLAAAQVSAMMEAMESWHAERISAPVRIASYQELRAEALAVNPAQLALCRGVSDVQALPLEWLCGEDLLSGQPCWVPFDAVSTNFVESPLRPPLLVKSSNGLASGNHVLEALVHALLELIERDALALWQQLSPEQKNQRQLDLATVADPVLAALLQQVQGAGVALAAWDITTDSQIPTFTCTLIEDPASPHWRPMPAFSGHGSHFSPAVALSRAVHEAIQSRVTVIAGSRDDMFPDDYAAASDRAAQAATVNAWRSNTHAWPFGAVSAVALPSFEDDLALLLTRLHAMGAPQVVAVDLTHPDFQIPVVKVVVPGIEPYLTVHYQAGPRALQWAKRFEELSR